MLIPDRQTAFPQCKDFPHNEILVIHENRLTCPKANT
jgi:hypothetical protein